MFEYQNIPRKYLNQLAKVNKIVFSKLRDEELIQKLVENGHKDKLDYLENQFMFSGSYINLCKVESDFPDATNSPENLLKHLIDTGIININQIDTEWRPELRQAMQICALKQEESTVYLKIVEGKVVNRRNGYDSSIETYAHFTSVAIHYGEDKPLFQLRCAPREAKKYAEYLMKILGFGEPYRFDFIPKMTRENARELCDLLTAGIASTHVSLPSQSLGSFRVNAKKGFDLENDQTYVRIRDALNEIGLATDDTMDETCFFSFKDPVTSIEIESVFEVNIKKSYFKLNTRVTEAVFDHVLDAFVKVTLKELGLSNEEEKLEVMNE